MSMEPVFLDDLDAAGRELVGRAASAPRRTPTWSRSASRCRTRRSWNDGRLESRALMLRVFLAADGHGDYTLMPGGLARIAADGRPIVSTQRGGSSKDTWVLSDPDGHAARRRTGARRASTRSSSTRASRAAPPSTSSGWAATPSAPRAPRGCCAPSSPG